MKNLTFKTLFLIVSILFSQTILSQTLSWENHNILNTDMPNYRNGTLGSDVAYDNYGFPAVVGVPKSLHRAMYKLSIILSANFLVTNDRRSAYDDVLIFFIIKTFSPPLLVFQKVACIKIKWRKLSKQTFWSPTTERSHYEEIFRISIHS